MMDTTLIDVDRSKMMGDKAVGKCFQVAPLRVQELESVIHWVFHKELGLASN